MSAAPGAGLALFTGVTLMKTTPSTVPNAPSWNWVGGATWQPIPRWKLTADASWMDKEYVLNPRFAAPQDWTDTSVAQVGRHFVLNGRLAYDLPLPAEHSGAEIFLAAENLTDQVYDYRPGYPMPREAWSAGVNLSY